MDALFSKGKVAAGKELHAAASPALVPNFLEHAWSQIGPQSLDWALHIITGTKEPLKTLSKLKVHNEVCGQVWKPGDLAYKCRTCEMDPAAAVCPSCFKHGDHKGHDFALITTGGGQCDCGDHLAWKSSGFCKHHKGLNDLDDPLSHMPVDIITAARPVLKWAARKLVQLSRLACLQRFSIVPIESEQLTNAIYILQWLLRAAELGGPMKRLLFESFSSPAMNESEASGKQEAQIFVPSLPPAPALPSSMASTPVSPPISSLLDALLCIDFQVPEQLLEHLYHLYFSVILDPEFKKLFISVLAQRYNLFIQLLIHTISSPIRAIRERTNLFEFTVQTFTVNSLVYHCESQHQLIATLIKSFQSIVFTRMVKSDNGHVTLDFSNPRPEREAMWRVLMDLRYCIAHSSIAQYIMYTAPSYLSAYLKLFSLAQSCIQIERIDSDDDTWTATFSFELELAKHMRFLLPAIRYPFVATLPPAAGEGSSSAPANDLLYIPVLGKSIAQLNAFFETRPDLMAPIIKHNVAKGPETFQLPLHRFFASVLMEMGAVQPPLPSSVQDYLDRALLAMSSSAPSLKQFASRLLEHPLRIQVLLAQAGPAKLWQRNNCMVQQQALFYQCPSFCAYGQSLDIFLLQACATFVGAEKFVDVMLQRYKYRKNLFAIDFFGQEFEGEAEEVEEESEIVAGSEEAEKTEDEIRDHLMALEEEFLHLLFLLCADRSHCGLDADGALRRALIHRLALGKQTHSVLVKSIPKVFISSESQLESVLKSVSIYHKPTTANQQGAYSLQESLWNEVDVHYLHYSRKEVQRVEETYNEMRKQVQKNASFSSSSASTSFQKSTIPSRPPCAPLYPAWHQIPSILHNKNVHGIITSVLLNAVRQSQWTNDTLFNNALHVLTLSQQTYERRREAAVDGMKSSQEKPVRTFKDIEYPSDSDLCENALHIFSLKSTTPAAPVSAEDEQLAAPKYSLLLLLLKLRQRMRNVKAEQSEIVQQCITRFASLSEECRGCIEEFEEEERREEEEEKKMREATAAEEERKKEFAKAKQREIMAKFAAQQSALQEDKFLLEADEDEDELLEREEREREEELMQLQQQQQQKSRSRSSSAHQSALMPHLPSHLLRAQKCDASLLHNARCALCHDAVSPNGHKHLGFITLAARSRVVRHAFENGKLGFVSRVSKTLVAASSSSAAAASLPGSPMRMSPSPAAPGSPLPLSSSKKKQRSRRRQSFEGNSEKEEEQENSGRTKSKKPKKHHDEKEKEKQEEKDDEDDEDQFEDVDDEEEEEDDEEEATAEDIGSEDSMHDFDEDEEENMQMEQDFMVAMLSAGNLQEEANADVVPEMEVSPWTGLEEQGISVDESSEAGENAVVMQYGEDDDGPVFLDDDEAQEIMDEFAEEDGEGEESDLFATAEDHSVRNAEEEGWTTEEEEIEGESSSSSSSSSDSEDSEGDEDEEGPNLEGFINDAEFSDIDEMDVQHEMSERSIKVKLFDEREGHIRDLTKILCQKLPGANPFFWHSADESDGTHVHFCGHALHMDCYHQYCSSLLKNFNDQTPFKGANVINLEEGEFLCPLCGRLGNSLCPILPPSSTAPSNNILSAAAAASTALASASSSASSSASLFPLKPISDIFKEIQSELAAAPAVPATLPSAIRDAQDSLAHRLWIETNDVDATREETVSDEKANPLLLTVFAHQIAALDISLRSQNEEKGEDNTLKDLGDQQLSRLRFLARVLSSHRSGSQLDVSQKQAFVSQLFASLEGQLPLDSSSASALPFLLCGDLFSLFVRFVLSNPGACVADPSRFFSLLRTFFACALTQGFVGIAANFNNTYASSSPPPLSAASFSSSSSSSSSSVSASASASSRPVTVLAPRPSSRSSSSSAASSSAAATSSAPAPASDPASPLTSLSDILQMCRMRFASRASLPLPEETLASLIELAVASTVPFLRRIALFWHILTAESMPTLSSSSTAQAQVSALCKYLRLPEPSELFGDDSLGLRVPKWIDAATPSALSKYFGLPEPSDALSRELAARVRRWVDVPISAFPALPTPQIASSSVSTFRLPDTYSKLISKYHQKACHSCNQVPSIVGICLTCGTVVCCGGSCCREGGVGEATRHARQCGSGTAVYLILKLSTILVIRPRRRSFLGSLYLDENDEEDRDLKRGKPLHLSELRLSHLRRIILENSWDIDTQIVESSTNENPLWY